VVEETTKMKEKVEEGAEEEAEVVEAATPDKLRY
jgi:hypothetical protein